MSAWTWAMRPGLGCAVSLATPTEKRATTLRHATEERLRSRFSFADLYGPYTDSWRVPPDQSLLCRDDNIIRGVPDRPFYASDLDPADYKLGQATCKAAGVKDELLDACILDTGV